MTIGFFDSFYYGIIIKFYKILGLSAEDITPDSIKKIEAFAMAPETKAAFKRIFQSYLAFNKDIIDETVQRVVKIAETTAKGSGQSLATVLFEIFIPILGPIVAGVNSAQTTVTRAMDGVNSVTDVFADTFKKIADSKPKVETFQKGGGFLIRQRKTRKNRRRLGGSHLQNAIQVISSRG